MVEVRDGGRQRRLYKIFKGFVFVIKSIPIPFASKLGEGIGLLSYYLASKDRKIAEKNLAACPLLPVGADIKKMAKDSFKHMALSTIEFIKVPQFSKDGILSMIKAEGLECIDTALAKGNGVILICAHSGNWELLGFTLALSGYPVCPLVKTQRGNAFDRFINEKRKHYGMNPIPVGFTLREVIKALNNNQMVVFVMDQNAEKGGIEADFLGRKAKIARGAAVAAHKTGAPVIAGNIIRVGAWRHKVKIVPVEIDRTGNSEEDIKANTMRFSKCLTEQILDAPEQWIWSYKRKWEE